MRLKSNFCDAACVVPPLGWVVWTYSARGNSTATSASCSGTTKRPVFVASSPSTPRHLVPPQAVAGCGLTPRLRKRSLADRPHRGAIGGLRVRRRGAAGRGGASHCDWRPVLLGVRGTLREARCQGARVVCPASCRVARGFGCASSRGELPGVRGCGSPISTADRLLASGAHRMNTRPGAATKGQLWPCARNRAG
jgi:hypothetical protein